MKDKLENEQKNKVALITGVTGQDGAYLAELLLNKGYIVHGIKRRSSSFNTQRIEHLYQDRHEKGARLFLHYGDLTDSTNIIRIINETQPDEIYNLAAMSHVHVSFETPEYTADATGIGTLRVLEAVRLLKLNDKVKIYQASTSELYGKAQEIPQKETTPFYPRSPYAAAKIYAYWITVNYREAYGLFACNGILFNHESPLRGETFITRKVTRAIAAISFGTQKKLYVGNLNALRDWGHAKDFVKAMHLILQQNEPDDFVIATGKNYSVRTFITLAFREIGIGLRFEGTDLNEKGIIDSLDADLFEEFIGIKPVHLKSGQVLVEVDAEYYRPSEVDILIGDPSKAKTKLGWQPKYTLETMISEMVREDIKVLKKSLGLMPTRIDLSEVI